jgi:hypothetical protein
VLVREWVRLLSTNLVRARRHLASTLAFDPLFHSCTK